MPAYENFDGRASVLGDSSPIMDFPISSELGGDCAPIFCPQDFPPLCPGPAFGLDIAISPSCYENWISC